MKYAQRENLPALCNPEGQPNVLWTAEAENALKPKESLHHLHDKLLKP